MICTDTIKTIITDLKDESFDIDELQKKPSKWAEIIVVFEEV